jgi:hypothetical protein
LRVLPVVLISCLAGAASAAPARQPLRGGPFEASGVAAVPGGVLIVDDSRPGEVLWAPVTAEGVGDVQPVAMGVAVGDPEGITTDGTWIYVVGSQSRGNGASLARFKFDPATRKATDAESMTGLETMLEEAVPSLRPHAAGGKGNKGKKGKGNKKEEEAASLNVEGLTWDPKGSRLLLGVRAPVVDGMALLVPLRLRDRARPVSVSNVSIEAPMRVDLGGSGIRAIEHDTTAGGYQIIAGHPTGARDFRLVTWSGTGTAVQEVQRFAAGEKPEGVTRVTIAGKPATFVVFDTSQYMVLQ